jgi:hypothetical protein
MSNKDRYGVIANIVTLINKHLQYRQDLTVDDINKAYKIAEQEQLALIGAKANKTTTVKELAMLFRDSCVAFAALGKRADLLMGKVKGPVIDPKTALDTAMRRDIEADSPDKTTEDIHIFGSLPMGGCGYDDADGVTHIVSAAYDPPNGLAVAEDIDTKILYLPLLFQYLDSINSTIEVKLDDIIAVDYISMITQDYIWGTRPLLGYYNEECRYVKVTNKDFINVFANKAKAMLESATAGDLNYYDMLQIKQELHEQLATVYFGTGINPLYIYNDLAKVLCAVGQGKITNKTIDGLDCYISRDSSILRTTRSLKEEVYEVNKAGLLSYVDALETLGLDGLTGVSEIIDLIKKHCV